MLVLSRKCSETIVIGGADDLRNAFRVTILEIRGGKVRLGIEADSGTSVLRREIAEHLHAAERPCN
jgi:carbon storage regulator